ncbi:hypothetical protein GLOIN_2v1588625 [Rhizophagus irregularis DAOM 181602=DAOM 197198]|nr:hypothetical protein GLOIN_2v1588625 [Rhizophagus irregularis DAOM 181602=DAOM 197198]POG73317.1 hypothetical protein GLOIN_2v1588625 [Rhizophagus irregularis DAOM 181602=DAOM 197198]|eukprot:XP_025180183.1 hypothetical protein GLOIN_2v1588625 [Rhizophagus irregularis DAOM 181602=DAOM 197198]
MEFLKPASKMINVKSKNLNLNLDENISHICAGYGKMYFKFDKYLELISEFIEEVKDAITSRDPQKLVKITETYGQFIPTRDSPSVLNY